MRSPKHTTTHNFTYPLNHVVRAILLVAICLPLAGEKLAPGDTVHGGWRDFGGAPDSAQYSTLTEINRSNVAKLEISWMYQTGDTKKYFFNPLVADGVMYVLAKNNSIVALNAGTGKELWVHPTDPETNLMTNRGINYWQSTNGSERRLLFASNNRLYVIDARTGKIIPSFGKDGYVDLREGLGRDPQSLSLVQSTTPGRVFENLLILGSATNQGYGSAPGDIRAYDIRSGELVWTFHTVPHPGEFGYDTWPKDAWKSGGGANSWSELSLDVKRGIVYVPTASPKYNFYGADRKGANLFGDCLVALNARTGKRIWHFQMVHHDIWDYDNATAPMLLSVRHNGELVDAVAQPSKEGFLWVFNRETGEPLWPVEERPVPRSDVPGEETWPTQPFPLKPPPFARQEFSEKDLSPYMSTEERNSFSAELRGARNQGLFTPPALGNTVEMPGNNGGANWGGAAVDPRKGMLYLVSKDLPCMLKLEPETAPAAASLGLPEQRGRSLYHADCQQCHLESRAGEPPAVPSLVNLTQSLSPAQIKSTIRQGRNSMPAFPNLSAADLESLVAYLSHPERAHPEGVGPATDNVEAVHSDSREGKHYVSGFGFMFTSSGLSPISPPWTSLTAYDLNEGTIKWRIPLGDVPELAAKDITDTGSMFPKTGPVVTAGGLIFTGTRDRKVRAIDTNTGKVLWEKQVDSPLEGIPAVYEVNGREYVVFCAAAPRVVGPGSRPASQASMHGAYVAFALPRGSSMAGRTR